MALLAAILRSRPAGGPAAFWWVLGFTALTLVPALMVPRRAGPRVR